MNIRSFFKGLLYRKNPNRKWLKLQEEAPLRVVCSSGEIFTVCQDKWVYETEKNRIFFTTWENEETPSANTLFTSDAIDKIHIPTKRKHAGDIENRWEKSERNSRRQVGVKRYSYVSNISSNPYRVHSFSPPVIEVWLETDVS